jgi:hypothetical protein
MLEKFERPIKIVCLAMAILLAWQLGSLVFHANPLAHVKIPPLPTLPDATNEAAKTAQKEKETNAAAANKPATNGTNVAASTNSAAGTNAANGTNALAKSTNASSASEIAATNGGSGPKHDDSQKPHHREGMAGPPAGMPPGMMAQMMGGMPGGPNGGMKKVELPPEVQTRVDRIIDSEIFGPVMRPMPMALLGIAGEEAFIQATNGQIGPVKVGDELAGVKLLRIGINRVLVEEGGEKKELTLFGGLGGESLMPDPASASPTNMAATNSPSTNGPTKKAASQDSAGTNALASHTHSPK